MVSSPILGGASSTIDEKSELEIILKELQRRIWYERPDEWVTERLGDFLWSAQRRILQTTRKHRKIAVKSCHGIGKSWTVARIAANWLDVNPLETAFVVTSAPSNPQIRAILWRYIGRIHSKGNLAGRVNQSEWYIASPSGKEELVAFGRKPKDFDPAAFQGIHARRVLVLFDEANGIRGPLHDAADSLTSNDESVFIMIGNPDDPEGEFYEACKPGSGWHVETISAFDSPNFTGEKVPKAVAAELVGRLYVEEKRKKWANLWFWVDANGKETTWEIGVRCVCPEGADEYDTHPYWQSKILGRFPNVTEEMGLIPHAWIEAAKERNLSIAGESSIGVDVGGGGDASTIAHAEGQRVRIKHEDHNPDTMHTCGMVIHYLKLCKATSARIDKIGIGRGVTDRGIEQGKPFVGVDVSESPTIDEDPELDPDGFINLRAQNWWRVRKRFELGTIDIDKNDEELASELASLRYKRTSGGQIQIESKAEAKKRGVASPNRAEALMLAVCPTPREDSTSLTWGVR